MVCKWTDFITERGMIMNLDTSFSVISIFGFCFFIPIFFFKIGRLMQVKGSKFIEEFDDKKKRIREEQEKIFKFKDETVRIFFCLFPYVLSILVCFCVSVPAYTFIVRYTDWNVISNYSLFLPLWVFLYCSFLVIEGFFGFDENLVERVGQRIKYHRPQVRVFIIVFMSIPCLYIDSMINIEQKKQLFLFLGIKDSLQYQYFYIFILLGLLNDIFVFKIISRWIVQLDSELYLDRLKDNNDTYSFYGMFYGVLSLIMIAVCAILALKYSLWNELSVFHFIIGSIFLVMISILAGQRDYYVEMTRRYIYKKKKYYYININNEHKYLKNMN